MALANCVRCKKVFDKTTTPICGACLQKEEENYELVYQYLKENPNKSVTEISAATEVSEKLILKFFRDGRFVDVVSSDYKVLRCEKCGVDIESGIYCASCKMTMGKDINKAFGTNHSFKDIASYSEKKTSAGHVTIMNDRGMKH